MEREGGIGAPAAERGAGKAAIPRARFEGVLVPALTPFKTDYSPDRRKFLGFCRWLLQQGANGLAVFGTTGEANSLSMAERRELLEVLLDGGIPGQVLMPGTGLCALPATVELTRHAVSLGCGGVLVLPPFYYKGVSEDGLFASYAEVIERVGDARLALYLYHFPQMTGVPLSLPLIERLAKAYPTVVLGIKDSSGDWEGTMRLLRALPQLAVFPSSESRLLDGTRLGAAGCISASANLNVAAIRRLYDGRAGAAAQALHASVSAVRAVLERQALIPSLKGILAIATGDAGWSVLRPPLMPLPAGSIPVLMADLRGAGLDFASLTEASI